MLCGMSVMKVHKYSNRKYYSLTERKYATLESMCLQVCQGKTLVVTNKTDGSDATVDTMSKILTWAFEHVRPPEGKQTTVQGWLQDTIRHCWQAQEGKLVSE